MSRCGLTIIETLAALVLLSTMLGVLVGWTTGLQRDAVTISERHAWRNAATRTLDRIGHCIRSGVHADPTEPANQLRRQPLQSRVSIGSDGGLVLVPVPWRSRHRLRIELDDATGQLMETTDSDGRSRLLLGNTDVATFSVEDSGSGSAFQDEPRTITVRATLIARDGEQVHRVWSITP